MGLNKDSLFEQAVEKFKLEDYQSTIQILKQFLDYNTKNDKAYNILGLAYLKSNDYKNAIKYFNKAFNLNNNYEYILNISRSYQKKGEIYNSINFLLKNINESNKLRIYRELGNIYFSHNMLNEALDIFLKIIQISPKEHQAYNNCGLVYLKLGNFNSGYNYIEKAISINPTDANYFFNIAFFILKEYDDFFRNKFLLSSYQDYLYISNTFIKKIDVAKKYLLKAISLDKNNPNFYNELGKSYLTNIFNEDDCNNAIICFKNAITLNPNNPIYYSNLAFIYNELGLYQEAGYFYKRTIDAKYFSVIRNYAYFLMKETDCNQHIDFLEEQRIKDLSFDNHLIFNIHKMFPNSKLLTSNDVILDKVVFVVKDEAIGDELQFVRYLKLLKDNGAYIKISCSNILKDIFKVNKYCDEVFTNVEDVGSFDYFIPLLSIPSVLNKNSYRLENSEIIPYLSAPEEKQGKWFNFFKKYENKKIAFTWKSNFPSNTFYKRSTDFNFFYDLAKKFPNIEFFSIQKGFFESEFHNNNNLSNIHDLSNQIDDFSDSAGILENIDLLLSIDSAIVHLAGAMNKPVTMLVPYSSDWRWGISGSSTFWYPSMEIIRQTEIGNWQTAFDQVVQKFKKFT